MASFLHRDNLSLISKIFITFLHPILVHCGLFSVHSLLTCSACFQLTKRATDKNLQAPQHESIKGRPRMLINTHACLVRLDVRVINLSWLADSPKYEEEHAKKEQKATFHFDIRTTYIPGFNVCNRGQSSLVRTTSY